MIGIRTDANSTIATGHMMRCLSIAKGLVESGQDVLFICADENSLSFIDGRGFECEVLDTPWEKMESEVPKLLSVIERHGITQLIVDSYLVTGNYLHTLSFAVQTIYIDDLNAFDYPVDILLNYNIYAMDLAYKLEVAGKKVEYILGPKYAPLRQEFCGVWKEIKSSVTDVLITTGGADLIGMAQLLVDKIPIIEPLSGIHFHVISGKFGHVRNNPDSHNITIHCDVQNVAELMMKCDIAITAAGFTMYELCACGVPAVSFIFADNQILGAEKFDKMGLITYAGDARKDINACADRILSILQTHITNFRYREKCSDRMQRIIDGHGIQRIVDSLV